MAGRHLVISRARRGAAICLALAVAVLGVESTWTADARASRTTTPVTTIPTWSASVTASQDGQPYSYTMVGQDPRVPHTNATTTITANVIPIVLKFPHRITFDPTKASCGESTSAVNATLDSPVFQDTNYTVGGTFIGDTQFADAFQRANFWAYTNPHGVNPGYHVLLTPFLAKRISIHVPSGSFGEVVPATGGCGSYAIITRDFAISQLTQLLPKLHHRAFGVSPATFPIFLLHNVIIGDTLSGPTYALGVHYWFQTPSYFNDLRQTFAFADFEDSGALSPAQDVLDLAHEVAEWIDDPYYQNATPSWGNTVGNPGCQSVLEVGDPLNESSVPVTLGGVTYHVQDLAFASWFYGQGPSPANGAYSFEGTFTGQAPLCPPGGP